MISRRKSDLVSLHAEAVKEPRAIFRAGADFMEVCCRTLIGINAGPANVVSWLPRFD